jgi:hypothetical protein
VPAPERIPRPPLTGWRPRLGPDFLAVALGALWLGDAVLQLQPGMFTPAFSGQVLYGAALMYQPPGLSGFLLAVARVEAANLTVTTLLIAAVQLAVGAALLVPATRRAGLVASAAWASVVWVLGEGVGFLATGTASLWSGAPGAALIYLALSILALRGRRHPTGLVREGLWVWTLYWGMGALLDLAWRYSPGAVMAYNLQSAAQSAPGVLQPIDYGLARLSFQFQWPVVVAATTIYLVLAAAVWIGPWRRPALTLGLVLLAVFWVFGQGLGGVFTGVATDINSAPLMALLAALLLSSAKPSQGTSQAKKRDPAMTYSPTPLPGQYHRR